MASLDKTRNPRPVGRIPRCLAVLAFVLAGATAAHAAGRTELLMFESATCEWCDLWRSEIGPVYPKTDEGKIAPLRAVSIHVTRPDDLKGIAGIVYTPTFVLWDGEREVGRILGYGGEIQFWGLLGQLIKKWKSRPATPIEALPADQRNLRGTPVEKPRPKGK